MSDFLVSVVMITYKQEEFIKKAISGVLNQKFNFGEIELLIVDDCSPDHTKEVVGEYPKVRDNITIKYIRNTTNKGIIDNFFGALSKVSGKYIAICEGDDYWTDPYKLQKQVDFLEANEEYMLCATRVTHVTANGSYIITCGTAGTYTIDNLAKENLVSTPTAVFRAKGLNNRPDWVLDCPVGDWPLWLFLSQYGKVQILEDNTTCYRVHSGGVWGANINNGKAIKNVQSLLLLFTILRDKFSDEVNVLLQENYIKQVIKLIQLHLKQQNLSEVSHYMQILFSEGCNLTQETNALTEAITNKMAAQDKELKDTKALNITLMTSTSYKLGRKMTSLFSFLKKS